MDVDSTALHRRRSLGPSCVPEATLWRVRSRDLRGHWTQTLASLLHVGHSVPGSNLLAHFSTHIHVHLKSTQSMQNVILPGNRQGRISDGITAEFSAWLTRFHCYGEITHNMEEWSRDSKEEVRRVSVETRIPPGFPGGVPSGWPPRLGQWFIQQDHSVGTEWVTPQSACRIASVVT